MLRFFVLLIISFIVGAVGTYLVYPKTGRAEYTSSPTPEPPSITPIPSPPLSPTKTPQTPAALKNAIEKALAGTKGTYAVVIKNLKTGEFFNLNEHRQFEPASLYKLWVMATVFQEIQNGKLKEDQILSRSVPILNDKFNIDSENAELQEGTVTRSVADALEQMITVSDNYTALLLSEKVGLSRVSRFLEENEFIDSSLGEPPQTTAFEVALFLEKLSKGTFTNEEYTKKMIELLKRQTLNQKLPKYLPDNLIIAHKTGEIGSFSHDAGIVFLDSGNYIIVVMTETGSRSSADERIANVSKAAYDFFSKK